MKRSETVEPRLMGKTHSNSTFYQSALKKQYQKIARSIAKYKPIKMTPWQKQLSEVRTSAEENATTGASDKHETAQNTDFDEQSHDFNESQMYSTMRKPNEMFYLTQHEFNKDKLQPAVC